MSTATYPAAEVDARLDELLALLDQSMTLNKAAAAAQAEVEVLRAKLAAAPAVVLEKVAGVTLDPEILARTLDTLIDNSYLVAADREKMASELQKNPNAILRLTERIASLSAPGHEEGQGVKSASTTETPVAAGEWDIVLKEGA